MRSILTTTLLCLAAASAAAAGEMGQMGESAAYPYGALLAQEPAAATANPPEPRVHDVVFTGINAYSRDRVLRTLRVKIGEPLLRTPEALAASLEGRYKDDGYVAARVTVAFDSDTGRLSVTVDEGRAAAVTIQGVEGAAAQRARTALALDTDAPVREADILKALRRLEDESQGALSAAEPPFVTSPAEGGTQVAVRVTPHRARWTLRLGGPGSAAFFNRADGVTPWLGYQWALHDLSSYNHTLLYAKGSFGFASREPRFALGLSRPFTTGGRLVLGYEFHDLADTDDAFRATGTEETLGGLLFRSSFRDYFQRRGHEAYAGLRIASNAQLGVNLRSDDYASLPVEAERSLFGGPPPRPNPAIVPGRLRSAVVSARWTSRGRLFADEAEEREGFLMRDLYGAPPRRLEAVRVDATYEVSADDAFGGDFAFRRLITHVRGRHDVAARASVAGRVLVGLTDGTPPAQKRFALGGFGTLRGYPYKQFAGDNAVLATVELGTWPGFPRPGIVAFYDVGTTWDGGGTRRWQDDVGVGLAWGLGSRAGLRVDVAVPLDRDPAWDRVRAMVRLHTPF